MSDTDCVTIWIERILVVYRLGKMINGCETEKKENVQ